MGQVVAFTFDTPGRSRGTRHRNYATGQVVKVGKRLSIKVLDDPAAHPYWREAHVGTIKVVSPNRVIPPLREASEDTASLP